MINCIIRGIREELDLTVKELPECSILETFGRLKPLGERLKPMVGPLTDMLREALDRNEYILVEGGQGRFLSVDALCSYPSCTSSVTTSNAVFAGLGLEMRKEWIGEIIGVVKAYQTAVGNHPMPTYIGNEYQEQIRQVGGEFGATTGRPRDCCWLNSLELREAARFCDVIYVTKLDVLSGIPLIPIATALYPGDNQPALTELPETWDEYMRCQPIYGTNMPGWTGDISSVRRLADLPQQAQDYLAKIAEIAGKGIIGVGVGPERSQFCN